MSNKYKGKLQAVPAQPATIAARLTITAFTDQPITVECTVDLIGALRLMSAGLEIIANAVEQAKQPPAKGQADPVDKNRAYLGPRR